MRWLRAYGWIPVPVVYTENMDSKYGGMQVGPVILIRPKYKEDVGLHEHELEHVEQAWRLLFLVHTLLYKFSDRYRLWAEVKAYRRQIAVYSNGGADVVNIDFAVWALTSKYGLSVTVEEAQRLLTN